jgi:hypothetical protein
MRAILAVCALVVAGCASNSGVVPAGPDTYLVSRQAATGFSGLGTLKADALREANTYCQSLHKTMKVVSTTEAKPPYILGNFPKAEVQFMCLSAGDPRLGTGN